MQRKRAFTLIELLVVIAIIAILAAILFPVFAAAKGSAKTAASISNAKQVMAAFQMYASDNDDRTPMAFYGPYWEDSWNWFPWPAITFEYARNANVYDDVVVESPVQRGPIYQGQNWTPWVTFAANERGFLSWLEWTDADGWVPHDGRMLSAQENLSKRCAIASNRQPDNPSWGFFTFLNYTSPYPNTDPTVNQGDYWWNNNLWISTKDHRKNLIVGYGDSHAKAVRGESVFLPQNENTAGRKIDKEFWGDYASSTK